MARKRKLIPVRYSKISLLEDSPERTHHAVIFNIDKYPENGKVDSFIAKCRLPELFTWTPTGHGSISNWNFATNEQSEQLTEEELALLVPRSLWVWFLPRFVRNLTPLRLFISPHPKDLFYLEVV